MTRNSGPTHRAVSLMYSVRGVSCGHEQCDPKYPLPTSPRRTGAVPRGTELVVESLEWRLGREDSNL